MPTSALLPPPPDQSPLTASVPQPLPSGPVLPIARRKRAEMQPNHKARERLAKHHRRQRDELSILLLHASRLKLPESYINHVMDQIAAHDKAVDLLVGVDSGKPTLHMVGSNLLATMKALGWIAQAEPRKTIDPTTGFERELPRYRLKRRLVVEADWVISEEQTLPLLADIFDISELGVSFIADRCLTRDCMLRLKLDLDRSFAVLVSVMVISSRRAEQDRWHVGGVFNHLR